jgi:hypothetical protein
MHWKELGIVPQNMGRPRLYEDKREYWRQNKRQYRLSVKTRKVGV